MRIPKRVNAVLDRAERHAGALLAVIVLVAAALAAMWVPLLAGFILGIAFGGFAVHVRMSKRIARSRREIDDLLRENGGLRHRYTVLASGVITREAQVTQALVAIPEYEPNEDPQRTQALPALFDTEADEAIEAVEAVEPDKAVESDRAAEADRPRQADRARKAGRARRPAKNGKAADGDEEADDGSTSDTADLAEIRQAKAS
ncbi:hypothetical protein [Actinomadura sp. 9N407]|uniref:hypothetical protein n=1 Tax=Actinomadura sp. 9N407 TaxID=3375154 RepID=UPI0037AD498D